MSGLPPRLPDASAAPGANNAALCAALFYTDRMVASEVQRQVPFAVWPNVDENRSLDIPRNGPYATGSAVAAWCDWGGGDPNEVRVCVTPDLLMG